MSDRVEVVSLGVGWVRHLKAQAREAWRDFPVWIGLGTAITVGAVLICPRTPTGIGVLTFAMVLVLGALSWMSRPDRAVRLPVSKLMLLGFVTCLPQLPLMIMAADKEGVVVSSILLIVSVVLSTVASPLAAMGFMVAVPTCCAAASFSEPATRPIWSRRMGSTCGKPFTGRSLPGFEIR